jgi:hypothetical protein
MQKIKAMVSTRSMSDIVLSAIIDANSLAHHPSARTLTSRSVLVAAEPRLAGKVRTSSPYNVPRTALQRMTVARHLLKEDLRPTYSRRQPRKPSATRSSTVGGHPGKA